MRRVVRTLRRTIRTLALLGLLLAVVISGWVALYGRDSLQMAASRWLSDMLHAEVSYDTSHLGLVSGVEIRGLSIDRWPTETSSLHARRLLIRPDWGELLGGTLRFRSVQVDDWIMVLRRPASASPDTAAPQPAPAVEIVEFALRNGNVLLMDTLHTMPVRVVELEGLVRLGGSESSVRLRSLHAILANDLALRGQASLWRLGTGSWDAQAAVSTDAGDFTGTASEAEGGWTWDVAATGVVLSRWVQWFVPPGDSVGGIAAIEASGQGREARGRIEVSDPRWGPWSVDELAASVQIRPGAVVARRMRVRHEDGLLEGSARFTRQPEGWRVSSSVMADSLTLRLPPQPGGVLMLTGHVDASGWVSGGPTGVTASLTDGELVWKTWRAQQVDAGLEFSSGTLRVDHLTIGRGTMRGTASGQFSAQRFDVHHDLRVSLGPLLAPFTAVPCAGEAHFSGLLQGEPPRVSWAGVAEFVHPQIPDLELASAVFSGSATHGEGPWHAAGTATIGGLRSRGNLTLVAARADLDATPFGIDVRRGLALRPGGVLVSAEGVWEHGQGRISSLMALSDRWALATTGETSVLPRPDGVKIPKLHFVTSGGGVLEARDLLLSPDPAEGWLIVRHLPVDAAARLVGLPGRFEGRAYGVVQAGPLTQVWASIKGLRRLPTMREFPMDLDLQLTRSPAVTAVHSLELTQADLHVTAHGAIDSSGAILAEATSEHGPLGRVLVLSDELLNAGLRPILDARKGTISAHIMASGTLRNPILSGEITVDGGAEIVVKPMRTTFRSVEGDGRLEGHSIIIDKVTGSTSKGTARLSGRLELPSLVLDAASFTINGRGQEFKLVRGIYGVYDADVQLAKRGKGISLEGEARLIEGLIDLPSIPIEPLPPTEAGLDDQWFVTVVTDRGVWARDRFLNAEVAGRVVVAKEDGVVSLQGDLELLRGTYLYLGRRFTLESGTVRFMGGPLIVPELDVAATTVIRSGQQDGSDITLTLTVTGRADDPVLQVTADDESYAEEQIKTMLLFNLTPEDVMSLWQGDAFAKEAAGAVEEFLAAELVRVLRAEAGLDELEVSPNLLSTDERDLYVRLGKYLTPDLFVSVARGLRSMGFDEVRVEYLLGALAKQLGLGKNVDLKLVGERLQDEYSRTSYHVQMKLKYKF